MNVLIYENEEQIGIAAGNYMCGQVLAKPNSVLGLATGSTPLKPYGHMIKLYENGAVDFSKVTTFNLDEYCRLDVNDVNSYHRFMHDNLFDKVDIKEENVNFLDGNAKDWEQESKRYAEAIKSAGGIDIQLLGIGTNGHIGFNEPADAFTDEAFKVALTQSTIDSNQKYFGDVPMPRYALTMGIGSIMRAKTILLIATGESKAQAVKGMIKGEVTPKLPASVLNEHKNAIIMLDKAAASLL